MEQASINRIIHANAKLVISDLEAFTIVSNIIFSGCFATLIVPIKELKPSSLLSLH
jgi:hypothetical protein